jgi:hypothetical protein
MEFTSLLFDFLKELSKFSYELSALDRVWNIIFPDQEKKWHHLHINKYGQTFYITHINGDSDGLEVEPKKNIRVMNPFGSSSYPIESHVQLAAIWRPLITSANKWLKIIHKDWIKANKSIYDEYPLRNRYGVVSNSLI